MSFITPSLIEMTYPNANPKPITYKDGNYLKFIGKQPCRYCNGPAEPHHVLRHCWGNGMGKKSHDYVAVPRCRDHHGPKFEYNVKNEIIELLMKYIEDNR